MEVKSLRVWYPGNTVSAKDYCIEQHSDYTDAIRAIKIELLGPDAPPTQWNMTEYTAKKTGSFDTGVPVAITMAGQQNTDIYNANNPPTKTGNEQTTLQGSYEVANKDATSVQGTFESEIVATNEQHMIAEGRGIYPIAMIIITLPNPRSPSGQKKLYIPPTQFPWTVMDW